MRIYLMSKSNKKKLKESFIDFVDIVKKPSTKRAIDSYIDRAYTDSEAKIHIENVNETKRQLLLIRKDYSKQLRKERNDAKN